MKKFRNNKNEKKKQAMKFNLNYIQLAYFTTHKWHCLKIIWSLMRSNDSTTIHIGHKFKKRGSFKLQKKTATRRCDTLICWPWKTLESWMEKRWLHLLHSCGFWEIEIYSSHFAVDRWWRWNKEKKKKGKEIVSYCTSPSLN
jgi:hypothetical protein